MFIEQVIFYSSFLFVSFAISVDAFSVSLSIGLQNTRLKTIVLFGLIIGIFHTLFPFIGIIFGRLISSQIEQVTSVLGGFILLMLGAYMFISAFSKEKESMIILSTLKLIGISFVVSVDSFSVGLGLGISGLKTVLVVFMFGIMSAFLSWTGLLIGRKIQHHFSRYAEMVGGVILFFFGVHIIFLV